MVYGNVPGQPNDAGVADSVTDVVVVVVIADARVVDSAGLE
jgi:hypothetical protein